MTINVVCLILLAFTGGYFIGKGKVVFEKKVVLTEEERAKIEHMQKEQQDAIDKYNETIKQLTDFNGMGV